MKANRKFTEEEIAVSAVIGVILMVAITVAIAAVTFIYFTGIMGGTSETEKENAAIAVIVDNGKIKITLIKGGHSMTSTGYSFSSAVTIRCNGPALDETAFSGGNTGWDLGESLYIGNAVPVLDDDGSDVTALTAGDYAITVTLVETVIFDDSLTVI